MSSAGGDGVAVGPALLAGAIRALESIKAGGAGLDRDRCFPAGPFLTLFQ